MTTATAVRWPFVGRRSELERFADALGDGKLEAVLVTGDSGVGKSRLAQECLATAQELGHIVAHVHATASASAVPLSVLAPLLPVPADLTEPYVLFAQVRTQLREQAQGRRFVLAVDDIDLLDRVSLALLSFLLADGSLFVIATQRTETQVPDTLESRWRTGSALRIRLNSLERHSVETLLHMALGGPVHAAAADALWDASRGNILYLRELVWCAQADGTLDGAEGVWRLRDRLAGSAGIVELVRQRLAGLSPPKRAVLELLALCEPLGVDDLLEHIEIAILTGLEELGLIVVRSDGRRQDITLAHPLHAQALQTTMSRLQMRSLLLAQINRVVRRGSRRRGDPLLLASWRLDATGTADPALLVHAARLARYAHDLPRAERLAEAALRHGPDTTASLLLGSALAEQGRHAAAEAAYAAAWPTAADDGLLPLGLARTSNLLFGLGRVEEARTRLHETADRCDAAAQPGVVALDALLIAAADNADEAMRRLGGDEPVAGNPAHRIMWLRTRAMLLAETGSLDAAADDAWRAFGLHETVEDRSTVFHPTAHLVTVAQARLHAGRLADAQDAAERGLELSQRDGAHALAAWFPVQLGHTALARGRVTTAERMFRDAAAHAAETGQPAAAVSSLAGLALARAQQAASADDDTLAARLDEAIERSPRSAELQRARSWVLVSQGRHAEARQALLSAAQLSLRLGRQAAAVALLHDGVRIGDLGGCGQELVAVAPHVEGGLASARAAHARAALRRDPAALTAVGQTFQGYGVQLLAAECLIAAAVLHRADGDQRAASGLLARAAALVELCEGARTPGLLADTGHVPLSEREREIAALVIRGQSSREIATALFLSVRTVNNHLQNIYGKLGINSRAELVGLLAAGARAREDGRL
ncbi:LuxR C-terminal-related transcriptional regulator [Micromonospora sp. NBC_01412]|uniref:helix-turn-helix transcriptional regulator n=1 Tax=Micromonospora sp. NBC_01412 TaxID=2903590 RepID=UPI003253A9AD